MGVSALAPAGCVVSLSSASSKLCWASLRVKTLRLCRTCQGRREKEEICSGRNAKAGLGLALPRGKRGGATFYRLRGDPFFFFPSKVKRTSSALFVTVLHLLLRTVIISPHEAYSSVDVGMYILSSSFEPRGNFQHRLHVQKL